MLDKEKEILSCFNKHSLVSGGEVYIPLIELSNFIDLCNEKKAIIISIEIFKVKEKKIIPYVKLLGFDSSKLFDEKLDWANNLKKCNGFIATCNSNLNIKQSNLYFNAILSFSKS